MQSPAAAYGALSRPRRRSSPNYACGGGIRRTVVGVMPAWFLFPADAVWIPLVTPREPAHRAHNLEVVARLLPVAVASESLARRLWPGVDPGGRRLQIALLPETARIVIRVVDPDPSLVLPRQLSPGAPSGLLEPQAASREG